MHTVFNRELDLLCFEIYDVSIGLLIYEDRNAKKSIQINIEVGLDLPRQVQIIFIEGVGLECDAMHCQFKNFWP